MSGFVAVVVCLLVLFAPWPLLAQEATVTGIVTDTQSALVPGVAVTIRNTDTNISRSVVTNREGSYTVTSLPPGPYEITAQMQGFRRFDMTGVVLEVEQVLRTDIQLSWEHRRDRPGHRRDSAAQHRERQYQGRCDRAAGDQRATARRARLHGPGAAGAGRASQRTGRPGVFRLHQRRARRFH